MVIDGGYTSNNHANYADYRAPMITSDNTVIAPSDSSGGWQIQALNGTTGQVLWTQTSDYNNSSINYGWLPAYQPTIAGTGSSTEVFYQGAGGTVYERGNLDTLARSRPPRLGCPVTARAPPRRSTITW